MSEIFWIFIATRITIIKQKYLYNATIAFSKSSSRHNAWEIIDFLIPVLGIYRSLQTITSVICSDKD